MIQQQTTTMPVVAFAGGGTGGHIYPGLAIIGALKENTPPPPPISFGLETETA